MQAVFNVLKIFNGYAKKKLSNFDNCRKNKCRDFDDNMLKIGIPSPRIGNKTSNPGVEFCWRKKVQNPVIRKSLD
jgi:hypothetical protein